jgi:hypothetical protein
MVSLHVYANVNIVGSATVDVPRDELASLYGVKVSSEQISLSRDDSLMRHNEKNYIYTTAKRTSHASQWMYNPHDDDDDDDDDDDGLWGDDKINSLSHLFRGGGKTAVISLEETDDPRVVDGTGSLQKGLTAWIDKNLKYKKVRLNGVSYLINTCSLAPKYIHPFGYQVIDVIKVDMYPRNGYDRAIASLLNEKKYSRESLPHFLGVILNAMVVVEFALHMAYVQSLLHIVSTDLNEVMEGVEDIKYHLEMTLKRGSGINVSSMAGILGMFTALFASVNTAVSQLIAEYQKSKKPTKNLYAPYEMSVKYTAAAFELALSTVAKLREQPRVEEDPIMVSRRKQLQEFSNHVDDLTKQVSDMVRPGKLGFDSYGTLQRIRAAFEVFFMIVDGLQHVNLNPEDQGAVELVDLLTQFLNQCKK